MKKKKQKTDDIRPTMAEDIHYHPRREEKEHREETLGQGRPKTSRANSHLWISMSDVKVLFRSPTPFSFVDCNTLLSLGLVPFFVSSFPQQVFEAALASSTSWGLQHNLGFTSIALCDVLVSYMQGHTPGLSDPL